MATIHKHYQKGLRAAVSKAIHTRCEGRRRYGGAFTLGPVRWEQCKEDATVTLKCEDCGTVDTLPFCQVCWDEGLRCGIKIIEAKPIIPPANPVAKSTHKK